MPRLRARPSVAFLVALSGATSAFAQTPPAARPDLKQVASFQHQATGIAVTKDGRIFLSFPRWTEDSAVSVGELKDGKVTPYPNVEMNGWRNALKDKVDAKNHFVCVQTIEADHSGHLWVLDPAAPAMTALVPGGTKMVKIDLATNQAVQTIFFNDKVAPQGSYLNDVRFSPDDKVAYLTDSGAKGALVIVDLTTGKARRVLDGDPSTQADPNVTVTWNGRPLRRPDGRGVDFAADGIALSPDGKTLYWQAIKGKTLYSLPTSALNPGLTTAVTPEAIEETALHGQVKIVGENGPADGLIISRHDGKMYVTEPQTNGIGDRDLSQPGGGPTTVLQDDKLHWPDTFSEGGDGTIFFTTSHIQDSAFYKESAPIALPTELWSFKPVK